MRYRELSDRKISAYGAVLLITLIGSGATLVILHRISTINFTEDVEAQQMTASGY